MQKYKFLPLKNIIAKVHRDFRGMDFNENDLIDWLGEALGRLKIHAASQEATLFAEVKNYHVELPPTLHNIIQVAVDNQWERNDNRLCPVDICRAIQSTVPEHGQTELAPYAEGNINMMDVVPTTYTARFDLNNYYPYLVGSRMFQDRFQLVTLADHTFFNSIVCRPDNNPYHGSMACNGYSNPEYTIVGDNRESMRFSFKEGFVAISLTRAAMQDGLPMVPDQEYAREALGYFIAWKTHQRESYLHKEGARILAREAKSDWENYAGKFKSNAKMPHGEGSYLALREQMMYMVPRYERPYEFYGNMSTPERNL